MAHNRTGVYKGNLALGRYLKRVRKARKYTLKQVGQAIGCSFGFVWDLENGRRNLNNPLISVQLAEFLMVPPQTLFQLSGNIDNDLTSKKYLEVLRMTRNKGRAARIQHALDGIVSTADDILSGTEPGTLLETLCQKLKSFAAELDNAIRTA